MSGESNSTRDSNGKIGRRFITAADLCNFGIAVGVTLLVVNTIRSGSGVEAWWLNLLIATALAAAAYLAVEKNRPRDLGGWYVAAIVVLVNGFLVNAAAFGVNVGVDFVASGVVQPMHGGSTPGWFRRWPLPWE